MNKENKRDSVPLRRRLKWVNLVPTVIGQRSIQVVLDIFLTLFILDRIEIFYSNQLDSYNFQE